MYRYDNNVAYKHFIRYDINVTLESVEENSGREGYVIVSNEMLASIANDSFRIIKHIYLVLTTPQRNIHLVYN